MRKPQRGYARQDRVKEQIMRELAELVRTGLKDPRAGFITINEVEVTRDYSHATVFYTVLDDSTRDITEEALEHAKGHLRSELAKRIKLFKNARTALQIRRIARTRHEHFQPHRQSGGGKAGGRLKIKLF